MEVDDAAWRGLVGAGHPREGVVHRRSQRLRAQTVDDRDLGRCALARLDGGAA